MTLEIGNSNAEHSDLTSPGFFIGSYAAAPSLHNPWDPATESAFMAGLRSMNHVAGLELGFYGSLHRHDTGWFLQNIDPRWDYTITCIPGTMENLKADPEHGLASTSEVSRKEAIRFALKAREAALTLNQALGRAAVRAVVLHTAPRRQDPGSAPAKTALVNSLSELLGYDWHGAALWIEHCDAARARHLPAKGFLNLESELDALAKVKAQHQAADVGMLINWGRSALEERDPTAPVRHLKAAREAGLLRGLMFSGCTNSHPHYGDWLDTHAPFDGTTDPAGSGQFLMTAARAQECLSVIDHRDLQCLGFKVQVLPPAQGAEIPLGILKSNMDVMLRAAK